MLNPARGGPIGPAQERQQETVENSTAKASATRVLWGAILHRLLEMEQWKQSNWYGSTA